jgi:hypothetical protein
MARGAECFPLLIGRRNAQCNPTFPWPAEGAMPNRRQFLRTGATLSAFAVHGLVPRGAAGTIGPPAGVALDKAVYDDRYEVCRQFGAAIAASGVAVHPIEHGDVTDFWYGELDTLWREKRVSVAGVTQFGPMFVLERLATERRMRLALRAVHRPAADGTMAHAVSAPRDVLDVAAELCAARREWPEVMANLACRCTSAAGPLASATLLTAGPRPELAADTASAESIVHYYVPRGVQEGYGAPLDGPLYSWVIAPT